MFDARNVLSQGIVGGLLGGSLVGVGEAVYLLASAQEAADYQPLAYAAILYGVLGLILGSVTTALAQIPCALVKRPLSPSRLLALGLLTPVCSLGYSAVVGVLRLDQFEGSWPPPALMVAIGVFFGAISLAIYIVGSGLLERTMARVLLDPVSGIGVYSGLVIFLLVMHVGSGQLKVEPAPAPAVQDGIERPNVLLIVVEGLRADYLGCYGNEDGLTPSIDAMAAEAVVYEEAIAQSSSTRASFASIQTSLFPSSHGVAGSAGRLSDEFMTLAEAMRDAGYATAGRVTHVGIGDRWGFDRGYDDFQHMHRDHLLWASERSSSLIAYAAVVGWFEELLGEKRRHITSFYRDAEEVSDEAISAIENRSGQRWFLTVHYMDPHEPYFRHPWDGHAIGRRDDLDPVDADWVRSAYKGEVRYLDAHLGRLLDAVEPAADEPPTVVVLTSSHGVEFQEHGGWWHGATLYEEQIWVPLIVKYPPGYDYVDGVLDEAEAAAAEEPGAAAADEPGAATAEDLGAAAPVEGAGDVPRFVANGDRAVHLVRLIDIAPTLLSLAGRSIPDGWQGVALNSDWTRREPRDKLAVSETEAEGNVLSALRSSSWKLIEDEPGGTRPLPTYELFDLRTDAGEQADLSASMAASAVRERMHEQLTAHRQRTRGAAAPAEPPPVEPETCRKLQVLGYLDQSVDCEAP